MVKLYCRTRLCELHSLCCSYILQLLCTCTLPKRFLLVLTVFRDEIQNSLLALKSFRTNVWIFLFTFSCFHTSVTAWLVKFLLCLSFLLKTSFIPLFSLCTVMIFFLFCVFSFLSPPPLQASCRFRSPQCCCLCPTISAYKSVD